MDVLKYNLIELVPCEKVKYWAKQHERKIYIYIEPDGSMMITAEFTDGKLMWISTATRSDDVDANAAIIKLIMDTMECPNSEWYAADFSKLRVAMKYGIDRLDKAAKFEVHLMEDKYLDTDGEWRPYSENTPRDIAGNLVLLMAKINQSESEIRRSRELLLGYKERLSNFPTKETGWHYNYHKISPVIKDIEKLQYLKVSPDRELRSLYTELESTARNIYNSYQSAAR